MAPSDKNNFAEYWKNIGHGKLQGNLEGLERLFQKNKIQFINLFKQQQSVTLFESIFKESVCQDPVA